jgi:hypothetical protein
MGNNWNVYLKHSILVEDVANRDVNVDPTGIPCELVKYVAVDIVKL